MKPRIAIRHVLIPLLVILALASWLLLKTCLAGAKPEYSHNVEEWYVFAMPSKTASPDRYQDILTRANWSRHEWVVSAKNGRVEAFLREDATPLTQVRPSFDTTVQLDKVTGSPGFTLKVDDGWIVAYNRGEFGGALYWFSKDGKARKKISDHQVNEFLLEGTRIFAVQGLAHLGLSEGSIIEVKKVGGEWKAEDMIPLPGSGDAIARVADGDYVVVTDDALLRFDAKNKNLVRLVSKGDWLYPNSVAVSKAGMVYIGMRQFVVRCKLGKGEQRVEWLVPAKEWLRQVGK